MGKLCKHLPIKFNTGDEHAKFVSELSRLYLMKREDVLMHQQGNVNGNVTVMVSTGISAHFAKQNPQQWAKSWNNGIVKKENNSNSNVMGSNNRGGMGGN